MKKKSTLSNMQYPTYIPSASSTGNIQSNVSQQGYTKKKGCGCGKNGHKINSAYLISK